MADKDERKITGGNRRLAKKRVQCLNEALSFVSSSVLADSLVLRKPLLRQAPKRYQQAVNKIPHKIMPDKSEQERRRIIAKELRQKAKEKFEESLPLPKETFQKLFDFLDEKLSENNCDDTLKFTEEFFENNNIKNSFDVTEWLNENGGYCDCEVLNNVEEKFEDGAIL